MSSNKMTDEEIPREEIKRRKQAVRESVLLLARGLNFCRLLWACTIIAMFLPDVCLLTNPRSLTCRMMKELKKDQDAWDKVPEAAKELTELIAIRKALQSEILDDDGNFISLWDYALNRELEVLSAETGFARDTDEDPEDVRDQPMLCDTSQACSDT